MGEKEGGRERERGREEWREKRVRDRGDKNTVIRCVYVC